MTDDNKEYQAIPALTLERQIMDVNVPKSEREWWASKEIEVLREEILHNRQETCILVEELDDEIERLREALKLIIDHPVAESGQWFVGVKEIKNVARKALEGK